MTRRDPLPTVLADPFTVQQGLDAGLTLSRLRAGDIESPFHGIRRLVQAEQPYTEDPIERQRQRRLQLVRDCLAFTALDGRPTMFTHITAARLYGIPVPWSHEVRGALDVAAVAPAYPPQGKGVIGHLIKRDMLDGRELGGFPVPHVLDVLVQLASVLTVDELVVAGDGMVTRKNPLTTLDAIHTHVEGLRRLRGVRKLRAAEPYIRAGTDSAAESRMRLIIVRAGLPEPVVGHTVYDRDGFFVGTPDLAYVKEKIALDYEGEIHRVSTRTFGEDIERREQFQDAGWRHIRVVKGHITKPHRLVDRVGFALTERRNGR